MSDDPKVKADENADEKDGELTPEEEEQVSGGAVDSYIYFQDYGPKP